MEQLNFFDRLDAQGPAAESAQSEPKRSCAQPAPAESGLCPDSEFASALSPEPRPSHASAEQRQAPSSKPETLEEVWQTLKARGRGALRAGGMRSSIATVARVLDLPRASIPTDPARLGVLLREAKPATALVKTKHWQACCSRLRAALVECGIEVMPGRATDGLSPEWHTLAQRLPSRGAQIGLSRLLSYLSRHNIRPGDVRSHHLEKFRIALVESSVRGDPRQAFANYMRYWNEARTATDDWPQVEGIVPADPRRYSIPWENFPASFRDDVDQFLMNSGNPDIVSDDYHPSVAPSTVALRRGQLRTLASALVLSGFDIQNLTSLAVLVEPSNAQSALRFLLKRRDGNTGTSLAQRAILLRIVARYWVKNLAYADKISVYARSLKVKQRGMTDKNRQLLQQLDIKANRDALLLLPRRVSIAVEAIKNPSAKDALRSMMALAVEVLTMAPMRINNLAGLRLDGHLMKVKRGRERVWRIVIPRGEIKNRQPFDVSLNPRTTDMLETWLNRYRTICSPEQGPYLFPGRGGARRNTIALSRAISIFIQRETGITMNVHLFRHWCAKLHLEEHPQDIETVRQVLAHTNTSTTLQNYAYLDNRRAFKSFDATIERLRSEATRIVPLNRKPKRQTR